MWPYWLDQLEVDQADVRVPFGLIINGIWDVVLQEIGE